VQGTKQNQKARIKMVISSTSLLAATDLKLDVSSSAADKQRQNYDLKKPTALEVLIEIFI
jgi:hypothetical protein